MMLQIYSLCSLSIIYVAILKGISACDDSEQYKNSCPDYKSRGFCEPENKYESFMKKHCAKSCGYCDSEGCGDDASKAKQCPSWKEQGFCAADSKYAEYMTKFCPKTCGRCRKGSESASSNGCIDHPSYKQFCSNVKQSGYCEENSVYYARMQKYCNQSCGFCDQSKKSKCFDHTTYASRCASFKASGYCKEGQVYFKSMKTYCNKTCDLCDTGSSDCQDSSTYASRCAGFKASGYCKSGQVFYNSMITFCPRTCNLCNIKTGESDSCASGPSHHKGRVVGGEEAKPNSWPWQVALFYKGKQDCGGTLINKQWVLTAAHCTYKRDVTEFEIVLGEHDFDKRSGYEQVIPAMKIITHPRFSFIELNDDIALIKLAKPATINSKVQFACLPAQGRATPVGSNCFITGWGKTGFREKGARKLQEASLPVVSNSQCAKLNAKVGSGRRILDGQLCAGYGADYSHMESGCRGDSGGPFACKIGAGKWTVEGVVSSGSSRCMAFEKYTVFTRISFYRNWIDENIKQN